MSFFSKVTKYFESKIVFNTYALIILLFLLLFGFCFNTQRWHRDQNTLRAKKST